MRRARTADATGKPLWIFLFTDWDLLFCIPFTLLTTVFEVTRKWVFRGLQILLTPFFDLFTKANISLYWTIVLFPCFFAVCSWVGASYGDFSMAALGSSIALFLLGGVLFAKIRVHYFHIEDLLNRVKPARPLSAREAATVSKIQADAWRLEPHVRHRFDKPLLYLGWLRSMLVLPAFVAMLILPPSWLNYALMAYVALFTFNEFERIEHVSSHTTHGRLLVSEGAPWWARVAEFSRRCVVWPLFGWYPDYYYVTHALHHHVENNGPADWQSTIRYDRTSFLEFTKAVTWYSINVIFPIDTFVYLMQRRRYRILKILVRGVSIYLFWLVLLAFVEPLLFTFLLAQRLFSGIGTYIFVGVWHGFHNPKHPYDVKAANQHLSHYAHHAKPRVHLLDGEAMYAVTQEVETPSNLILLRPEFGVSKGFWRLQALLWRKDFLRASDALVEHNTITKQDKGTPFSLRRDLVGRGVTAEVMRELAAGSFPLNRTKWLASLDDKLSRVMGSFTYRRNSKTVSASVIEVSE